MNGQSEIVSGPNPVSGAIQAIATDPSNANTVYVGAASGGIWKTTDATDANPVWTPLTDSLGTNAIGTITISPSDSSVIYAGLGNYSNTGQQTGPNAGVLKSTDGGSTWTLLGQSTFIGSSINSVALPAIGDASKGTDVVLVGSDGGGPFNLGGGGGGGLFRSANGGQTWTKISGNVADGLPKGYVTSVVADPGDANRVYAALPGQGIFESTDGGVTWSLALNTFDDNAESIKIAVQNDPNSTTDAVYAGEISNGQLAVVDQSLDGGTTWMKFSGNSNLPGTHETLPDSSVVFFGIQPGFQGDNNFSLVVSPTDPNTLYVGGDRQPGGGGNEPNFPNSIGAINFTG